MTGKNLHRLWRECGLCYEAVYEWGMLTPTEQGKWNELAQRAEATVRAEDNMQFEERVRDDQRGKFAGRLTAAILQHPFKVEDALRLSDEIHAAEVGGHELTGHEDSLWRLLTEKIEFQKQAVDLSALKY